MDRNKKGQFVKGRVVTEKERETSRQNGLNNKGRKRPDLVAYNKKRAKTKEWQIIKQKIGDANRGKSGRWKLSDETKKKIGIANTARKNGQWKGDKVSYNSLHDWVKYHKGRALKCSICGKTKGIIDWSNINGKYHRYLKDYVEMCRKCHFGYEKKMGLRKIKNKYV